MDETTRSQLPGGRLRQNQAMSGLQVAIFERMAGERIAAVQVDGGLAERGVTERARFRREPADVDSRSAKDRANARDTTQGITAEPTTTLMTI